VIGRAAGAPVVLAPSWLLAAVGFAAGYAFGAAMDVWDWTFFANSPDVGWTPGLAPAAGALRFARFYLLTSFTYDSFRAIGNAVMVLLFGPALLAALQRLRARLSVVVIPSTP